MGKAHRKEMAASCHFRRNWFMGAVKNGFHVQLGVSGKLTAPLRGFLLDAILQHRSDGVTGASRSFWETQCTLRGFCQSPCSLNCVALFVLRLFKILPFWEGALMSVSDFAIQTPRVLFSMRTYEFLRNVHQTGLALPVNLPLTFIMANTHSELDMSPKIFFCKQKRQDFSCPCACFKS